VNEEQTWVLQAQRGNDEAFTQLVELYQTPVYNLCYRMLGEPGLAEDAAQETFLRAYRNISRYDPKRPFPTWLLSIAAHYCIDQLRRRRLRFISTDDDQTEFELPDTEAPDPEKETIRGEERERLRDLLRSLDTIDRAAIVLRYWHDFSEAEIAQSLNLTVSAVKSRLHRARKELGHLWQESTLQPLTERRPYESPAF
jgi:RNA polymerase sigma-70 factor (ECF subfamily)